MSKINVRSFSNENEDGAPDLVGITTFSATSFFVPTRGTTAQRPSDHVEVGSLRYNYDIKNLEYYRGKTLGWSQFVLQEPATIGTRGVFALGYAAPNYINSIDFITIATEGNAADFGDLTVGRGFIAAAGSTTRSVFSRGYTGSQTNVLDYVTIATQGNALDFGDATTDAHSPAGCGDSTRGLFGGGTPSIDTLEFFTFDSTGNATDFGNLYSVRDMGACSSRTRGIFAGGNVSSGGNLNTMEYVIIQSLGDGVDFGDLATSAFGTTGCSSSTRGIFAGGTISPFPGTNTIQFVTMSTTGNTSDFGDLNFKFYRGASCSSNIRAVIIQGSEDNGQPNNSIDFITIATTGNATDFGDKTTSTSEMSESGTSNGHGGL